MVWRVSRSYSFLLHGSPISEREIARGIDVSRDTLKRIRKMPFGAKNNIGLQTIRAIGSAYELPSGWMCMTPDVCRELGVEGHGRTSIEKAEQLRDQYPEWPFRRGSKAIVLLAQDTPLEAAVNTVQNK